MEPLNESWKNERRSPSKSRERRLAEVMHIAALRLEIKVHSEFLHDTELLRWMAG